MSGFPDYQQYDGLGLAELVQAKQGFVCVDAVETAVSLLWFNSGKYSTKCVVRWYTIR